MVAIARYRKKFESTDPVVRMSTRETILAGLNAARSRRLRSRVEFASESIVIPEGQYEGLRWRPHYQPYSYALLNAMDTMGYRRFAISGCVQSGKTLNVLICLLWHLFERQESVIFGIPNMDLAADKWQLEIRPLIESSPSLRPYLSLKGAGSQGGTPSLIQFTNGKVLKFMSAQGSDAKRSAFTAPVIVKTEVDRFDESTESSREADPARQMDARTESYGDLAWIYEECTVTTETGRIWQRFNEGTGFEPYGHCTDCGDLMLPKRDNLTGWRECEDEVEVGQKARFHCPACDHPFTEEERLAILAEMTLVGHGQRTEAGEVYGGVNPTKILSFKWNAWHNVFWTTSHIAEKEWGAYHSTDYESAERSRRQFAWALPSEPEAVSLVDITAGDIVGAQGPLGFGEVPEDADFLCTGWDLRKNQLHYVVMAFTLDGPIHIVENSTLPVNYKLYGTQRGVREALYDMRKFTSRGWPKRSGDRLVPKWTWIDAGWYPKVVYTFIKECRAMNDNRFAATLGRGMSASIRQRAKYRHPPKKAGEVVEIGDEYHVRWYKDADKQYHCVFINSDQWKTNLHEAFVVDAGEFGSITVYEPATEQEHRLLQQLSRHCTAERATEKTIEDKGPQVLWVNESRRANHYFDGSYLALCAGHYGGYRLITEKQQAAGVVAAKPDVARRPDGRPLSIYHRREG